MLNKRNVVSNFKFLFLKAGWRFYPLGFPLRPGGVDPDSGLGQSKLGFPQHPLPPVIVWFGMLCGNIDRTVQGRFWSEGVLGSALARSPRTSSVQELYCQCGSLVISWTFTKCSDLNPHKTTLEKAVLSKAFGAQDLRAQAQIHAFLVG